MPNPVDGSVMESTAPLSVGPETVTSSDALFIHPSWSDSPEVRRAVQLSGWPECTPGEFLDALHLVIEVIDRAKEMLAADLAARGLTVGEFMGLVADARANGEPFVPNLERDRVESTYSDQDRDVWSRQRNGTKSVRRLWLAGFDAEQIAGLLDWPVANIRSQLDIGHVAESGRAILALHRQGLSPSRIASEAKVERTAVYRILTEAGLKPHRERRSVDPTAKRAAVADYRSGLYSYSEISDRNQLTLVDVQNALRAAHKRGQCPEYGTRGE